MNRPIKSHFSKDFSGHEKAVLFGCFQGKDTYLWIGWKINGQEEFVGAIEKSTLYRLAKAIVKEFEKP